MKEIVILFSLTLLFLTFCYATSETNKPALLIFTVSTNETDGYQRYIESAKAYNLPVTVLGLGEQWEGGDMNYRGGGHKVNLLRRALKKYHNDRSTVVMFTDSYDVILLGNSDDLLSRFEALNASIVFSAEVFCWPDGSLASQYPMTESSYKYLNSGGYMGYASDVFNLLNQHRIKNKDDDQLYFSKLFLDKEVRETYRIRLDHKATIFQSVNGATGELKVVDGGDAGYHLENEVTGTRPLVLHGNGPSKLSLNTLSNYLAGMRVGMECPGCPSLEAQLEEYPIILMGIFIPYNTPFLQEFFDKIVALDYPKDRMHLYLYNKMKAHAEFSDKWYVKNAALYLTSKKVGPDDSIGEALARNLAIERCKLKKCAFFFSVDSVAHLDDPKTLQWLIKDNKGVVGPLLVRPQKAWSNFWGSINQDGFYARSFDYMDIVNNDFRGLWNVPYLTHAYLVNGTILSRLSGVYDEPGLDPDMAFCKALRDKGVFMYVENRVDAGHLITPDTFDPLLTAPELYEVFSNQQDWERRYIHPNYSQGLDPAITPAQPCPDVFWFPIVTPRFCKELITIMETFGQWSSGSNNDDRLAGGYENVPTRDIHMNQVGYERHWLHFLQQYVRPLQERVFLGYFHNPPKSLMNFVVRYRPDEQPSLKPHHDSSTYTINIALNQVDVDYQGGGCRFLRYNCSVTDTKMGWLLIHPGRLTHYHEGLHVLNGTRYIMISFVDP